MKIWVHWIYKIIYKLQKIVYIKCAFEYRLFCWKLKTIKNHFWNYSLLKLLFTCLFYIVHGTWTVPEVPSWRKKKKKKKGKCKRIQTKLKYKNLCIFYEYFDIEYTDHMLLVICEERCPHNKKNCTLNIQNYI